MKQFTLALAMIVAGGTAQAATCTASWTGNGNSGTQTVKYTLNQGVAPADYVINKFCVPSLEYPESKSQKANDTKQVIADLDPFGIKTWMLGDKTDDDDPQGDVYFASFTENAPLTWSVLNPLGYTSVMITLKQGDSFAAFLLDTAKALSGTWFTEGPSNSRGDISHASVWYAGEKNPAPVPLPAAAVLLPLGVASLALFRRRKSR